MAITISRKIWKNPALFLLALGSAGCGPIERGITVVSIQFDDGAENQLLAAAALEKHDMRGTFFVNKSFLDTPLHLKVSDILALQEAGHEIGGHSVHHEKLPFLPYKHLRDEVCQDRFFLQELGINADNFAYPAGLTTGATETVVEECGYESGRTTARVCESPSLIRESFEQCDRAEFIPPLDRFHTRSYGSIRAERIPDRIRDMVLDVESHGGGWVQLIFHYICDGCDDYGVSEAEFSSFLDFVAKEREGGYLRVATVREVIRGEALKDDF